MGFERNEISEKAIGGTELMRNALEQRLDPDLVKDFQIIMSRPRSIDQSKIRIIQVHDLPEDPESAKFKDESFLNQFHKLVFISNWQYQRYQLIHNLKPSIDRDIVIETGIDCADVEQSTKDNTRRPIRFVYTSMPNRGLDIAVGAFAHLAENYGDSVHLDVFSSFKIYGWDDADKHFQQLYDFIDQHNHMTYHGFRPNNVVREFLNTADVFGYPSVWPETSCRAMLEAMSAQCLCVHPNIAALPETSGGLNIMYQYDVDKQRHADAYYSVIEQLVEKLLDSNNNEMFDVMRIRNKTFVDQRYNIDRITAQWTQLLTTLKKQYPDEKSRQVKNEMFTLNI